MTNVKNNYQKKYLYLFLILVLYISAFAIQNFFVVQNQFTTDNIKVNFVQDVKLVPCGNTIGIKINTEGALVISTTKITGFDDKEYEPYKLADIRKGDYILNIAGNKVNSVQDILTAVEQSNGNELQLTLVRDNREIVTSVIPIKSKNDNKYKIGVWIRDGSSGIGTITFYNEQTKEFGALGHGITDIDTGKVLNITDGTLVNPNIIFVKKGEKGIPGELVGNFNDIKTNGNIDKNVSTGIYGTIENEEILPKVAAIPVASKNEIKEGKAIILSDIESEFPKEYEIELQKIYKFPVSESKSMLIKITDEELLNMTGGIIQGMSGSPIIQNGKLIGAITHVLVNDPSRGYGISIESMMNSK